MSTDKEVTEPSALERALSYVDITPGRDVVVPLADDAATGLALLQLARIRESAARDLELAEAEMNDATRNYGIASEAWHNANKALQEVTYEAGRR